MTTQITNKLTDDLSIGTLITALGALLAGAVVVFVPKFDKIRSMRETTKRVETGFWWLYNFPQYVNIAIVIAIWIVLVAALVSYEYPDAVGGVKLLTGVAGFVRLQNLIWILILAGIWAALITANWLSHICLSLVRFASFLPIPGLMGRFGPSGYSAGWHQARNVCKSWDKGFPLLIDDDEVNRLANDLFFRLTISEPTPTNFADQPKNASKDATANIAIFGCILEATHYSQHWKSPDWNKFYDVLSKIHVDTGMFDPVRLSGFRSGKEFFEQLRQALVIQMGSTSPPVPPDEYLAAAGYISKAWEMVRQVNGSVLKLVPVWACLFGGRLFWLDRRLKRFPQLNSDGMRPQLLKLLRRWGTIPWATSSVFLQPFSKSQAWLFLQESVLRALPEQKEVTFNGVGDVAICKIAAMRTLEGVAAIIRAGESTEAQALATAYAADWDIYAAADFVLWDWAIREVRAASALTPEASKGLRWKLEGGHAVRVS